MGIEDAWKSTCRVVLGGEIGELEEFKDYLLGHHYSYRAAHSSVSGKSVALSSQRYCENARVISQDEINWNAKYGPLDINDVKDLNSLISSLQERFRYTGNKIFGTSKFVEDSDNCTDAFYVKGSHTIVGSKYVAYSSFIRNESSHIFGSGTLIYGNHLIGIVGGEHLARSFESSLSIYSSDLFFCYNCTNCTQAMFSFNMRSKKYCIGNLELEKGKYLKIKEKLLEEAREYLKKHKKFYSVFDFAAPTIKEIGTISIAPEKPGKIDMHNTETAFKATTHLILGKELSPMKKYERLLSERSEPVKKIKTAFGSEAYYCNYFWCKGVLRERMVTQEEAFEVAKRHIELEDCEEISVNSILSKLGPIAFYNVDYDTGENKNMAETPMKYHSTDCFRVGDATFSKKCGYCTHAQNCESIFGCSVLMVESSFSIRCHDCVKVSYSMDMDCCKNCFRSMFCHNCENISDCMFCFNTKNKTYAIGNFEVGREKYLKVRKMVTDELLQRLEKTGTFGFDICNLGCYKGRK